MSIRDLFEFSTHLCNCMGILYSQEENRTLDPMRLAIAGVVDATLFYLMRYPSFVDLMRTNWRPFLPSVCADQARYRHARGDFDRPQRTGLPDEATLGVLFDEEACHERLVNARVRSGSTPAATFM